MYREFEYAVQSPISAMLGFLLSLIIFGIIIWAIIFWIKTIVHVMESKKSEDKIAWIILLVSLNIVGSLIYYYTVMKKENVATKKLSKK